MRGHSGPLSACKSGCEGRAWVVRERGRPEVQAVSVRPALKCRLEFLPPSLMKMGDVFTAICKRLVGLPEQRGNSYCSTPPDSGPSLADTPHVATHRGPHSSNPDDKL
ncbi:unnamed protein product [Prunus armeniaca]|uniref:Uncharacterized protein n=1 Tax=Prunus armeniaca TaxID=36596 RepID=A0A6J5WBE7_PRUAR|nr:unnamed protein product [Prunus armeniaca]